MAAAQLLPSGRNVALLPPAASRDTTQHTGMSKDSQRRSPHKHKQRLLEVNDKKKNVQVAG